MSHRFWILGLVVAASAVDGWTVGGLIAQEGPQIVTLEQAIDLALERNPTVQQAVNSARMNTLSVSQQQRALYPDLRFTTTTAAPYGNAFGPTTPSVSAGVSTSVQVSNVYSTLAAIDQAKLNEQGGEQSLTRTRQSVVFEVIAGHLAVLEAQEQVGVQQQNVASAEAQEGQIQAFVSAGVRPISDLYQQQATTAGARLSLVQAERGLVVARMDLIQTLQLDPLGDYEFVAPATIVPNVRFADLDIRELSAQALEQRPDLLAAEFQVTSADKGVRIADASRWPTLSLSLGYGANVNSSNDLGFFNQLDQDRGGTLQIGVSVPILDTTTGITRERARIQAENARISLQNTVQNVTTEVRTAYLDLELAEQQLQVAELQLRAADLALATSQQRYDVGAATLVELTQAQTTQVRAASDLVNARYGLLLQSRRLEYILGDLEEAES